MQRPDTIDRLFHDGNPATGQKGTPVTAAWLNALLANGAFLSGTTEPPEAGLGGPDDYYLCTASAKLYGPKGVSAWPGTGTSLIGPQGPIGLTGNPYKVYTTLAAANADLANIPSDALIWINADPIPANIGYWSKTGGVMAQSSYDRVAVLETKYLRLGSSKADQVSGKNLFNINAADVALGYYIELVAGNLVANAGTNVTGYMRVTGGATYCVTYKHNIAWYDQDKIFISGTSSTDTNHNQVAPANAKYLRCSVVTSSTFWSQFMCEAGSVTTAYEPYMDLSLIIGKVASVEAVAASRSARLENSKADQISGKNIFNVNAADVALGYYIELTAGNLVANAGTNVTGYMRVTGGATYCVTYKHNIAWYDQNKLFISGSSYLDSSVMQIAPLNAVFLRCSVSTSSTYWPLFMCENGTISTQYES
jgi:hypothetical protein